MPQNDFIKIQRQQASSTRVENFERINTIPKKSKKHMWPKMGTPNKQSIDEMILLFLNCKDLKLDQNQSTPLKVDKDHNHLNY